MHTLRVVLGGFALLALCLLAGWWIGAPSRAAAMGRASLVFLILWFVASGVNMWVGVARAGYSVKDEAPIFLIVFGLPAAAALLAWWRLSRG